jgi:2-polyprenyl-3-methyl-5-hydroxy-6-metoxy-1,4-benzoquinol methylase
MKDIIKEYYTERAAIELECQQENLRNSTLSYYYEMLFELISNLKPDTLLDVGCGSAAFSSLFLNLGITVSGIEFAEQLARKAEDRGLVVYRYDLNSYFKLEKKFDVVLISAVLEHLWDPNKLIANLKANFIRELIIVVPNMSSLAERMGSLSGHPLKWMYPHGDHIRFMNLKVVKDLVHSNDLSVIEATGYSHVDLRFRKLHLPRLISRFFPSLCDVLIVRVRRTQ